jgi:hypothetical protein
MPLSQRVAGWRQCRATGHRAGLVHQLYDNGAAQSYSFFKMAFSRSWKINDQVK